MHITRQKIIAYCNHFIKHWSKTRCTLPSESVTHPENQWLHYEGSQPYPFSALTRLVADGRPSAASWLPSLLKGPTQMACWAWHAYKGNSLDALNVSGLLKAFIAKQSNSPVPWTPKSSLKPPQAAGLYLALCACVWAPRVLHVCEHHGQRQGQLEKSVSQLACFYVWECMWTYAMWGVKHMSEVCRDEWVIALCNAHGRKHWFTVLDIHWPISFQTCY